MKVIILAAGLNKRFNGRIKCLLEINGVTFLENQLRLLSKRKKINEVILAVNESNYKNISDKVLLFDKNLVKLKDKISLVCIKDKEVKNFNNWLSLKTSLKFVDDDVFILNSDVWIEEDYIFNGNKNLIYCINEKFVEDESTKIVKKKSLNENLNYITKLSKTIPKNKCDGEAVGVYFIRKETLPYLKHELGLCNDNETYPVAVNRLIHYGHEFYDGWIDAMEVDDEKDYEELKKWLRK